MRAGKKASGYTIIEVMIFLAISGFMFIVAASFISGKQAEAEFRQSMNDTNDKILTTINDVTNGYYPNSNNIKCTVQADHPPETSEDNSIKQGENVGCVYMGRIIQFKANDNPREYTIYTVVGRQYVGAVGGDVPTIFDDAKPALVNVNSAIEKRTLSWGSEVTRAYMADDPSKPIYAIGIFSGFGKYTASLLNSASQTGLVVPITAGTSENDINVALSNPSRFDTDLNDNPNPSFAICFDGGRGTFSKLTIGSQIGQRLSSDFKIGSQSGVGC